MSDNSLILQFMAPNRDNGKGKLKFCIRRKKKRGFYFSVKDGMFFLRSFYLASSFLNLLLCFFFPFNSHFHFPGRLFLLMIIIINGFGLNAKAIISIVNSQKQRN